MDIAPGALWMFLWMNLWRSTLVGRVRRADDAAVQTGGESVVAEGPITDMAIDFITFCYQRNRREWPRLYDDMCFVASKRLYRGLGYDELRDAGIDLTFTGMARLSRIAKEVTRQLANSQRTPELAASY